MKKMISVLLTVCMVLSLFAVAAVSVGAEEPSYYLVGSMTDPQWEINEAYKLTLNTAAQGKEYMINNVYLESGTEFKVTNADRTAWYPNGTDNNYQIESNGYFDIYFRPDYSGNTAYGWHYGTILAQRVYAVLKGYTTTVADSVALNFYMYLDETNLPDYATLTWGEGNRAKEVTIDQAGFIQTDEHDANYKFTADVAAVSMNDEVTLTLHYDDNSTKKFTGSVVKYCNLLSTQIPDTDEKKEQKQQALDNMLDYGAAVQEYFDYRPNVLANANNGYQGQDAINFTGANADSTDYANLNGNAAFGVKFKGAILSTTSKLALRLYFDVTNTEALTVTVGGLGKDGMNATLVKDSSHGENAYYVEIGEIASCNLFDGACKVIFTRGEDSHSMRYDVRRYAKRAIAGNDNFANVMTRLYYYSTTIGAAFDISAQ